MLSTPVRRAQIMPNARQRFVLDVGAIVGQQNIRAFYLPDPNEGLVVPDAFVPGRLWTHVNPPAGRITRQGQGAALAFNGTSDYLSTPDANDLSFGNGTVDSPLSVFSVLNLTDTATNKAIISKDHNVGSAREYSLSFSNAEILSFTAFDQSVPANFINVTDAAVATAVWSSIGMTYSAATGGATAANDVAIYRNGASIAQTPANGATYVAMENLGAIVAIGSTQNGTSNFFSGLMAMVLLVAASLSAAQQLALHRRCQQYGLVA